MPNGSQDGMYTLTITGADTVKMPQIQYSSLGIYTYKLYQLEGTNKLATYDDRQYNLVVYVTNAEDGSGLETTVLLYLEGEEGKLDEVVFENEYDPPAQPVKPDPPDKPEPPKQPAKPGAPKTGDDTLIWPYVGLFISGVAVLVILGVTIKKKRVNE